MKKVIVGMALVGLLGVCGCGGQNTGTAEQSSPAENAAVNVSGDAVSVQAGDASVNVNGGAVDVNAGGTSVKVNSETGQVEVNTNAVK